MKGQISFDILLTGVVLVIFFGALLSLTDFLGEKVKISAVREQEREILSSLVSIITNAKAITDAAQGSKITFKAAEIITPTNGKQECSITFNTTENKIVITTTIDGQETREERNVFFDTTNLSYNPANCGEEMTIEKR